MKGRSMGSWTSLAVLILLFGHTQPQYFYETQAKTAGRAGEATPRPRRRVRYVFAGPFFAAPFCPPRARRTPPASSAGTACSSLVVPPALLGRAVCELCDVPGRRV